MFSENVSLQKFILQNFLPWLESLNLQSFINSSEGKQGVATNYFTPSQPYASSKNRLHTVTWLNFRLCWVWWWWGHHLSLLGLRTVLFRHQLREAKLSSIHFYGQTLGFHPQTQKLLTVPYKITADEVSFEWSHSWPDFFRRLLGTFSRGSGYSLLPMYYLMTDSF